MFNFQRVLAVTFLTAMVFSSTSWAEVKASNPRDYGVAETAALGTLSGGFGIEAGQAAPDADLRDIDGNPTTLSSLWEDQSLLVVFYRGGWCPFCNAQIRDLTEEYAAFESRNVLPVMISVDAPDAASLVDATYDIPFPVLSDSKLSATNAYNVASDASADYEGMLGRGTDLEEYSGESHHTISLASAFLIAEGGQLVWSHADPNYRTRPTPTQFLSVIDENIK